MPPPRPTPAPIARRAAAAGLGAGLPTCPPRRCAGLRLRAYRPSCCLHAVFPSPRHFPCYKALVGCQHPRCKLLLRGRDDTRISAEHPAAIWVPASSQLALWKGRWGRGALSCAPSTHVPVLELAQRLSAIALGVLRDTCCGEAQGTARPCCAPASCPWLQRCPRAPAVAPAGLPGPSVSSPWTRGFPKAVSSPPLPPLPLPSRSCGCWEAEGRAEALAPASPSPLLAFKAASWPPRGGCRGRSRLRGCCSLLGAPGDRL